MTGETGVAERSADAVRRRTRWVVVAVAAIIAVLVVGIGVRILSPAPAESLWSDFPSISGETVLAERSGQDDSEGYWFSTRLVEAPGVSDAQLTAAYAAGLKDRGWTLLESYEDPSGAGFSRVCLASGEWGEDRLADIRAAQRPGAQFAGRVEVVVSVRVIDRGVCGEALGRLAWPEVDKPAG